MDMNPDNNIINDMNNMMNMNQMMLNQDNNNSNQSELISNLINQNIQMANQIAINNNSMKSMINNFSLGKKISLLDLTSNINFFPGYEGRKINVIFEGDNLLKINIITPINVKMKDLLAVFHIKLQMLGKDINLQIGDLKDYIFVSNGHIIYLNEEKTVNEFGLDDCSIVIFKKKREIIGG